MRINIVSIGFQEVLLELLQVSHVREFNKTLLVQAFSGQRLRQRRQPLRHRAADPWQVPDNTVSARVGNRKATTLEAELNTHHVVVTRLIPNQKVSPGEVPAQRFTQRHASPHIVDSRLAVVDDRQEAAVRRKCNKRCARRDGFRFDRVQDPGGAGVPNADDALFQGTAGDSKQLAIRAELERGDIVM